ncbi:MAG: hypothetical protein HPY60_11680 [Candidatus Methanofastidiosum sp.]|nr:hypothetical protein [Methanofastidiosum sp.]
MEKNYKEILNELEDSIKDIEVKGISIKPLNDSLDELKKHSENIERIENNIDAIREEVIDRIKQELDENKKAGMFSIFGFWVGAIALVLTTIQIYREITKPPFDEKIIENPSVNDYSNNTYKMNSKFLNIISRNDSVYFQIESRIEQVENSINSLKFHLIGFDDNYKPDSTEFLISLYENTPVLNSNKNKISIKPIRIHEEIINNKILPFIILSFYLNGKQLGPEGMKECLKIKNNSKASKYDPIYVGYSLSEGDIIIFFNKYEFIIERIYRKESNVLKIADNNDAVLLKKIK